MFDRSYFSRRVLSLAPPVATEAERAELQRRMALGSLLVFGLAFGFWFVNTTMLGVLRPEHLHHMWSTTTARIQLATTAIGLVVWFTVRRGSRSVRFLGALDAVAPVAICTGWAVMGSFSLRPVRPDLVGLLASTYTLVMRAALVPSGPARTASIGVAALVPLVALEVRDTPFEEPYAGALHPAVYVGIWALLGVVGTTTISAIIFGLRAQVRKAEELGQYRLEEKIGEGGMGVVYRARHLLLRRPTAIKLISDATPETIARFEREVQITAGLTHPNTIAIFDYGHTPDGVFYYVMEYLDGISLEDLVAASGPQPPARVVSILLQACGALEEAHQEGFVHRDVKPANLMLTKRGGVPDVVKVLDFGLVKEGPEAGDPATTGANKILGTPHYLAPESILEPATVDAQADVYALGATAFFLLTAERVFDGRTPVEVCSKHLHEAPRAPSSLRPGVPAALDAIVASCLEKDRAARPRGASALAARLREAGVGLWTPEDARAWWGEAPPRPKRDRKIAAAKSVVVALDDRQAFDSIDRLGR
jgi:serine/threonine-protein kinase